VEVCIINQIELWRGGVKPPLSLYDGLMSLDRKTILNLGKDILGAIE